MVNFFECLIVYISLDLKTKSLVQEAIGKTAKIETISHRQISISDTAELRTNEGKLYGVVAIDRTSKFAVALLVDQANRTTAWEFLETVREAVPYRNPLNPNRHTASNFVSNRAIATRLTPGPCGST